MKDFKTLDDDVYFLILIYTNDNTILFVYNKLPYC
jgi:hypothetical protein